MYPREQEQPVIDYWPMRDEDLSKITAAFDIEAARRKLAKKFNTHKKERTKDEGTRY
jgi:hypothetical protein